MKVLFVSSPSFVDLDVSLMRAMRKYAEVHYLLQLTPYWLKSSFVNIETPPQASGLYAAQDVPEFAKLGDWIDMDKAYVQYRKNSRRLSLDTIRMQLEFQRLVKKLKPDIIHFNNVVNFQFIPFLLTCKIPMVITYHDPIPHSSDLTRLNNIRLRINLKLIKNSILLNKNALPDFLRLYGKRPEDTFTSKISVCDYLCEFKKKDAQRLTILFFGRIEEYKGVEYLLQAFNKICKDYPNAELLIAGRGKLYWDENLHKNNPQIKIYNNFIENRLLTEMLQEAKFVVCPYKDATQSGVIMSAYALETPVISTNVGGLGEYIEDGKTGFLVPPCDADAIAEKMKIYLNNPEILTAHSQNIRKIYYEGEYSWDAIALKDIECYNRVIAKNVSQKS